MSSSPPNERAARFRGALAGIDDFEADHAAAVVFDASGVIAADGALDHPYALASVTKLFSAFATLVAIEECSVALTTAAGPSGSTIAHLLSHASGLGPSDPQRPLCAPGTRRIYSNAGFEVLADVVASAVEMDFDQYAKEAVFDPLEMHSASLGRSAAKDGTASANDLVRFGVELLAPSLVDATTLHDATSLQFGDIDGVLPGFGHLSPCDWGLGFELKSSKVPHWTGASNSPATFGHFGMFGSFCWIDPWASLGLVVTSDRLFGPWAKAAWPPLSDAVLAAAQDDTTFSVELG